MIIILVHFTFTVYLQILKQYIKLNFLRTMNDLQLCQDMILLAFWTVNIMTSHVHLALCIMQIVPFSVCHDVKKLGSTDNNTVLYTFSKFYINSSIFSLTYVRFIHFDAGSIFLICVSLIFGILLYKCIILYPFSC